jgi:aspartate racemase
MKTIGLIGGTGWISTQEYYKNINEMVNARLGGLNFAKCILYSFNYAQIDSYNKAGDVRGVFNLVLDAALKLESTGADGLVLCANTLHQYVDELATKTGLPLVHVAEATAREIKSRGLKRIGLLGTRITMERDFYKEKLRQNGLEAITPEKSDIEFIHTTIMQELLKNIILEQTKARFIRIINDLANKGAEGIILGCTEIPLLIKPGDTDLPTFNTLEIHCQAAVDFALG